MYSAYTFGLSLGAQGSRFRDALIDARIEFQNDYGGWFCKEGWGVLRLATQRHPDCKLRELVALVFVGTVGLGTWLRVGPLTVGDWEMVALVGRMEGGVLGA